MLYTEAEPLLIQALEMYKKLLSAEHPSVASSLHDLAFLYESQGRYTEAEPLFIQALDMTKKLLGSEQYLLSKLGAKSFYKAVMT